MKCVFCGGETKQMLVIFSYEEETGIFSLNVSPLRFVNDVERRPILPMLLMGYRSSQKTNLSLSRHFKCLFLILLKVFKVGDQRRITQAKWGNEGSDPMPLT